MSQRVYAYLDIYHPVVAWNVYRGVLISAEASSSSTDGIASLMLTGMIHYRDASRLQNELLFESVRVSKFPRRVSRLTGMYFFDRKKDALLARKWGAHFHKQYFSELDLYPVGEVTRVDANWIDNAERDSMGRIDPANLRWVEEYWSGKQYDPVSPIWEIITRGRAVVLGTGLRKRAYDVVAKRFPDSLDLLEISRLAAAVGYDLGRIVPIITQVSETTFRIAYYFDMRDPDNPEFLEKIKQYGGSINYQDLAIEKSMSTLPDLMEFTHEFKFTERFTIDSTTPLLSVHHVRDSA